MHVGDKLVKVDGTAAEQLGVRDIARKTGDPDAKQMSIEYSHDGQSLMARYIDSPCSSKG
jgi:hypothetical protein